MSTVRVLHVIAEMGVGGAETIVADMVRRGQDVGWVCGFASAGGTRADALAAEGHPGFPMRLVRRSPLRLLGAGRDVHAAVRAFRPDVVVAHNVSASVAVRMGLGAIRRSRRPHVVTVFHGVAREDYPAAARALRRCASTVVTVSAAIAERLRAAGLSRVELTVIPNAVGIDEPIARAQARSRLGIDGDRPVVLSMARLTRQKRHDLLLEAWEDVDDGALLLIAGDGPLRAELERRAASLIDADRVRFLGNRSDVDVLLGATDVTVLTSDWEGLPMAVLESLAAGRPVVATAVDGVSEVLVRGGELVEPGDSAAISAALTGLLREPTRRAQLAAEGRALIRERHDPRRMMNVYDELIRSPSKQRPSR